jgi:TRAP-type mannitol/chloroaromatic compound transport system permease small subunit
MVRLFLKIADLVHGATAFAAIFALIAMLVAVSLNVGMRYVFSVGSLPLQDAAIFAFGAFSMLSVPCAFQADRHVRVDIIEMGKAIRCRLDLAAILFLLMPLVLVALWHALPSLVYSWAVAERSPQIGGLPFFYLLRTVMPVALLLSLIQALGFVLRRAYPGER